MSSKPIFDQYLVSKRFRESQSSTDDSRNAFENDFTRVVFSSSFRRLQDKTQVFQLDKGDFVFVRVMRKGEPAIPLSSIQAEREQIEEELRCGG